MGAWAELWENLSSCCGLRERGTRNQPLTIVEAPVVPPSEDCTPAKTGQELMNALPEFAQILESVASSIVARHVLSVAASRIERGFQPGPEDSNLVHEQLTAMIEGKDSKWLQLIEVVRMGPSPTNRGIAETLGRAIAEEAWSRAVAPIGAAVESCSAAEEEEEQQQPK